MKKWIFLAGFAACLVGGIPCAQSQETDITQIISAVNSDSLMVSVRRLSGATPIQTGGTEQTIRSRNKHYAGNDLAADYLASKLANWGLDVENQWFSDTGRNVIGIQTGHRYPDQKYILCAHYDSMPDSAVSPGADDNASGVAAVLEAARILAQRSLNFSVVYALWDEEEYGFYGSLAYATRAASQHESILGVINLDMIGWDGNNDQQMIFDVGENIDQNDLYDMALGVIGRHHIELQANTTAGPIMSDQRPFREAGFQALGIHEYFWTDTNTFYHSTEDKAIHLNQDYFRSCTQLAVGTLASLAMGDILVAVEQEPDSPSDFNLAQNFPNPFNPTTVISYSIMKVNRVLIRVWDERGRQISILEDRWREPGQYSVSFDGKNLPSGVYTYQIQSGGFTQTRKMLLLK